MRKYLILSILFAGVFLFAKANNWLTSSTKKTADSKPKAAPVLPHYWWVNNDDTYAGQFDPNNYSYDYDQFPSCSPSTTSMYCEIYAEKDPNNQDIPKMNTITSARYKPW